MLSAVAEIERENILVQTMEGRRQKAREGKWNGGQAPFGYRIDQKNGTLVVHPEEAAIVKIIYDKFVNDGMGADSICNYLNQRGYVKERNRDFELNYFSRGLIMHVLDNPAYIGKITYGKRTTKRIRGTRDQYHRVRADDYMITDGKHEPIIDEQLWEDAQEKRRETGVKWNKTHSLDHEHLLSGLVKCPICGAGMAGSVRRRKNKKSGEYKDDFYYRCHHRRKIDEEHFCNYRPSLNQNKLNAEVEKVILNMVGNENFKAFILKKMEEKVDVSTLEEEREQVKKQLQQAEGAKAKLTDMLDRLDVSDRHYDRKYQDMQERIDNLYDKITELDDALVDISSKISGAYEKQITAKQVYQILTDFDKVYYRMTDLEKKEFLRDFIETIELYPEKQDNGRILKQIAFKFPVYYGGNEGKEIRLPGENTVETVCLLSSRKCAGSEPGLFGDGLRE